MTQVFGCWYFGVFVYVSVFNIFKSFGIFGVFGKHGKLPVFTGFHDLMARVSNGKRASFHGIEVGSK
jgi:hypothetical protein